MPELPGADKIFKCLQVHEELPLVIVRSPAPDCPVVDFRFERIGFPKFERIYRLNIIMTIHKDCRKFR